MPRVHCKAVVFPAVLQAVLSLLPTALAVLAGGVAAQAESDVSRQLAVLERFVGTWDVSVRVKRPAQAVVTYTETVVWADGKRWLRGDTGPKSDGTRDWSMTGFDEASGGYPLWIFSSTGAWYYLAPGKWDEGARSIDWRNPPLLPVSHRTHCVFVDARTRQCSSVVKDWKGSVLLEQDYKAVRREP
jgi:hypothetical protein